MKKIKYWYGLSNDFIYKIVRRKVYYFNGLHWYSSILTLKFFEINVNVAAVVPLIHKENEI